jgi:GT2 family glycosyltransferase
VNSAKEILWIAVAYRRSDRLVTFLRDIQALSGWSEIVFAVVFNQPEEGAFEDLEVAWEVNGCRPELLTRSDQNLGYFGGAALALEKAQKLGVSPRLVVVSNYDLVFPDIGFIEKLGRIKIGPDVGVVGPRVTSIASGCEQSPLMNKRPRSIRMWFYSLVFSKYWTYVAYSALSGVCRKVKGLGPPTPSKEWARPSPTYAVHGAFLVFTDVFFERGGSLQYPGVLFGEEIYVAEQCRDMQLEVVLHPELLVLHEEHVETGSRLKRGPLKLRARSSLYLYERYFADSEPPS